MSKRQQEYSELLKDPRWQKVRLQVFERDDWTCRFCGNKERTLSVHHTEYISGKKPWEYDLETLLTLCEDCHSFEYKYRKEEEESLLRMLRIRGASISNLWALIEVFELCSDAEPIQLIVGAIRLYLKMPAFRKDFLEEYCRFIVGMDKERGHDLALLARKYLDAQNASTLSSNE